MHLESADDIVILRSPVTAISDRDAPTRVAAALQAKYVDGTTGEPYDLFQNLGTKPPSYRLTPEIGRAWLEGAFETAHTRWTFPAGGK